MAVAVLLRNGLHDASTGDTREASIRYALKCDSAVIQFQKTPIQIPIPQQSPELFDLGIIKELNTKTNKKLNVNILFLFIFFYFQINSVF